MIYLKLYHIIKIISYKYTEIMNKLPTEIIMNKIIPYTYSTQSQPLRKDITTFYFIYNRFLEIYNLNKELFNNDFSWFMLVISDEIQKHYRVKILNQTPQEFRESNFNKTYIKNKADIHIIRTLLAKMQPVERLKFVLSIGS